MTTKITCTIKGISPILMHRFPLDPVEGIAKMSPEQQAEIASYRDEATKQLYIPAMNLQRALVSAARFSKGKGRGSLQTEVCACVFVSPESLMLGVTKFVVDRRSVVVPATKGRIVAYRPRLDQWQVTFDLEYDHTLLSEKQIRKIVDDAGSRIGVLDFRPEKKGPFGRFVVTNWK